MCLDVTCTGKMGDTQFSFYMILKLWYVFLGLEKRFIVLISALAFLGKVPGGLFIHFRTLNKWTKYMYSEEKEANRQGVYTK